MRFKRLAVWSSAFLFFNSIVLSAGEFEGIGPLHLQDLSYLRLELQKNCPPVDCVVTGIGRSPTPVIAYLQSFGNDYALQVPLSGFGKYSKGDMSEKLQKKLFEHFDNYLGSLKESGKKVLLVDYSPNTFGTLTAAQNYITKYLGNSHQVNILGITLESKKDYSHQTPLHLFKDSSPMGHDLFAQAFDEISAFGSYDLEKDHNERKTESESYQRLVKTFSITRNYLKTNSSSLELKENVGATLKTDLESSDPSRQSGAALLLGFYHGKDLNDLFKIALKSPNDWTKKNAFLSLSYHAQSDPAPESQSKDQNLIRLVESIARGPDPKSRNILAERSAHFNKNFFHLFQSALDDPDQDVRYGAINSLFNYDGLHSEAVFESALKSKKSSSHAVTFLQKYLTSPNYQEAVASRWYTMALNHEGPGVRSAAAYALSKFKGSNIQTLLKKAIEDENADVRTQAFYALSSHKDSRPVFKLLLELLKHQNPTIRAKAAESIRDFYPDLLTTQLSPAKTPNADALKTYLQSDCSSLFAHTLEAKEIEALEAVILKLK